MAFTYQSVINLARIPLNDPAVGEAGNEDGARYLNADLLSYANQGILALVKRRPDLFVGQYSNLPTGEAVMGDAFPLDAGYVQLLADYVVARGEMMDDEHVSSGRAAAFAQLFGAEAPV